MNLFLFVVIYRYMSYPNPGHFLAQTDMSSRNSGHFLAQQTDMSSPNSGHFLAQNMSSNPLTIEKMEDEEEELNEESNMNLTNDITENSNSNEKLKLKDVNSLLKNQDIPDDENDLEDDEDDDRVEVCLSNQLKKKIFYRGFA